MSNPRTSAPYDFVCASAESSEDVVERACIGLTWTTCRTSHGLGLAMSPGLPSRVLPWPGTLAGQPVCVLARWLKSWDPFEATVGLAACNAVINRPDNPLMREAEPIRASCNGNLAVFEYFRPRLEGRRVAVIGRYPGMDAVLEGLDVTVLERQPAAYDLPDPAAEFVLPQADWVFLTATSLINKTFHRLCELSREAVTVLMGPSVPWLVGWTDFGIDFLAGVQITDPAKAEQIAAEGGGTRLFEGGVGYAVADIGASRVQATQLEIQKTVARRQELKSEMDAWYGSGNKGRFSSYAELEEIEIRLSRLDTRYKRLWDARQSKTASIRSSEVSVPADRG